MLKSLTSSACAAAILLSSAGIAAAQMPSTNKPVYFTFSKSVELPRLTLPAGKYLFRLTDSMSTRTIVQVLSEDGKKVHGIFMTVPTQRPTAPDKAEVRFLETAANTPPAIATYWYPGDRTGWEFVYPRDEATRLARSSKQPVLSTVGTPTNDQMQSAELARISPEGQQMPLGPVSDSPSFVGETTVGEAAPDIPAPVMQTAQARTPRTRLPSTASSLPLATVAGVLALFAAFGLGLWRRVQA